MSTVQLVHRLTAGVTPAMATPLSKNGDRVNRKAIPHLVDFLVDAGVAGLFVGGTTGEGILLSQKERLYLHEAVMEAVDGRVPVLVHVGANDMASARALSEHAAKIEVDAIVAVTPYFYPIHEEGLLAYYQAIAEAAPTTPLLAYDIPHMAVNGVSPTLVNRLAAAIPTFAGVKSSNADAQKVRGLLDAAPAGTIILAGNERIALGSLALGAAGLISGLSTAIPEPFVSLTRSFAAGDLAQAQEQQRLISRLLDLIPAGERIGTIKGILVERGIDAGPPVPPRPPAGAPIWDRMAELLEA